MSESNGLPSSWCDAWSAYAVAFNGDIQTHIDTTSNNTAMNAPLPVADYDSDDASLVLREEDPDIELRLDQMFESSTKF